MDMETEARGTETVARGMEGSDPGRTLPIVGLEGRRAQQMWVIAWACIPGVQQCARPTCLELPVREGMGVGSGGPGWGQTNTRRWAMKDVSTTLDPNRVALDHPPPAPLHPEGMSTDLQLVRELPNGLQSL